jgi:uncharacterized protein (DUF58 family)
VRTAPTWRAALRDWRSLFRRGRAAPSAADEAVVAGDLLYKLDRLSLAVSRDLLYGLMGEHRALRRMPGIEFADYRPYHPGDDLRRVDWNLYARQGHLYVRQAQAEQDTFLYILLDASASMNVARPSKFLAGRRLAAALGYLALAHLDSVLVNAPGTPGRGPVVRSRPESGALFRYLQDLQPGAVAPFDDVLAGWSTGRGQGRLAVVISDLLLDSYQAGVRQLVGAGFQVTILHLLSPDELRPADTGDLELLDNETGEMMEIHLGAESLGVYHERLAAWLAATEAWCRDAGAGYLRVESDWDVERILMEPLRRKGVTA